MDFWEDTGGCHQVLLGGTGHRRQGRLRLQGGRSLIQGCVEEAEGHGRIIRVHSKGHKEGLILARLYEAVPG